MMPVTRYNTVMSEYSISDAAVDVASKLVLVKADIVQPRLLNLRAGVYNILLKQPTTSMNNVQAVTLH